MNKAWVYLKETNYWLAMCWRFRRIISKHSPLWFSLPRNIDWEATLPDFDID